MLPAEKAGSALRSHVTSVQEALMTDVSFMIPFVTIGGIFLALGFAAGDTVEAYENTTTTQARD